MKNRFLLACFRTMLQVLNEKNEPVDRFSKYLNFNAPNDTAVGLQLGPEHISDLTELLVQYAHKWRFIGTALHFQPQDLDNIQACPSLLLDSPRSFLVRLLEDWLLRKVGHTLPPTKNSLVDALKSQMVGLGMLASRVQEMVIRKGTTENFSFNFPYALVNVSLAPSESSPLFKSTVVVEEGTSTLFEILASSQRGA